VFAGCGKVTCLWIDLLFAYSGCLNFAPEFFRFTSMNTKPFLNLLRAYRKRTALSQKEIAFLIGSQSASKVSRYEKMTREPELKTALALEAVFKCPISDLFPALFEQIQAAVRRRAKRLGKKALKATSRSLKARKSEAISGIINRTKKNNDKKK
jgi:transcriptional regulator with XRE-family HTH domain